LNEPDADGRNDGMRMTMLDDASGDSLTKTVQETIETGRLIRTNGWGSYTSLLRHGSNHGASAHKNAEAGS
jgi:hypothetical protein